MCKRLVAALLILCLLLSAVPPAVRAVELDIPAPSAVLMDAATGQVLYEKNDHERLRRPA